MPERTPDPRLKATEYFRQAYERQKSGDFDEAIQLYTRSIEIFPTAEAYTFRGWTYSFKGDYQRAIAECLEAIKVDPEFGNPYNDIGAYLIEQQKWDEAVPWLERAARAKRYDAPFFPWMNLGRVHLHKYDWDSAKQCFRKALELNGKYTAARIALRRLQAMWN